MSEENMLNCKVVLLGETSVGKTSLISRYVNNTFETNGLTTTGASYAYKAIYLKQYNKSIKFEIWDTAGQEKFRSLAKVFYKNAAVCILVYEITRRASFEELKKYWIEEIKTNGSKNISKLIFLIYIFLIYSIGHCCK